MELNDFLDEYLDGVNSRDKEKGQKIFDTKKSNIKILEMDSSFISLSIPSERNNQNHYTVDFYFEDYYTNYDCSCQAFENYDD